LTAGGGAIGAVAAAGPASPPNAGRRIRRTVWLAGTLVVGLIAAAAILDLARVSVSRWLQVPGPLGDSGWSLLLVIVAAGSAFVALSAAVGARSGSDRVPLLLVAGGALAARLLAIAAIPTPLETDWANYHRLAVLIADSGPQFAEVATGWPMLLAIPYRVFGPEPILGEVLNAGAGVATAVIAFVLARRAFGRPAGAAAGATVAVFPSHVLMTVVLASETVFALLIAVAALLALVALRRGGTAPWLAVGLVLGVGQYVRPAGVILLAAFAVLPWLASARRPVASGAAVVVAFLVVLAPVVAWNRSEGAGWSVTTSRQGNWNLLVGLNQEHDGHYNTDDAALVGGERGTREFDVRAGALARERLLADPAGAVALAVRKFPLLWGPDRYAAYWAVARSRPADIGPVFALGDASQIAWVAVTAGAAIALWRRRDRQPAIGWLTLLCVGGVAAAHTVLEIQERYHAFVAPLLIVLAAGLLTERPYDRSATAPVPGGPDLRAPATGAVAGSARTDAGTPPVRPPGR
jgi:hypothetical protein